MNAITTLLTRTSTSRLGTPVPDPEALRTILQAALRAPDHGALRPWRFLVIEGDGLARLADVGADALRRRDPDASQSDLDRAREKLTRAPMAIAIGARIEPGHKIPEVEQVLSVGAAAMNLLNALHALGFAGKWVTGPNPYDPFFAAALGFAAPERCYGMIMVGTAEREERPARHDLGEFVRHWH